DDQDVDVALLVGGSPRLRPEEDHLAQARAEPDLERGAKRRERDRHGGAHPMKITRGLPLRLPAGPWGPLLPAVLSRSARLPGAGGDLPALRATSLGGSC